MRQIFRIGEFSKLTQVSIRMLRYYDEAGLLKPAETDPFTKYRLYSAAQIPTLNGIVFLRDLGFSVAEIAEALSEWNDASIAKRLDMKQAELETIIRNEQDRLSKLKQAREDARKEKIAIHCSVSIKSVPSCKVLSLRRRVPDYYAEGTLWKEMTIFAEKQNVQASSDTFTIYHDPDYRETDVDIEICAPVDALGERREGFTFRETQTIPMMAYTMVYGPFENIAGAYLSFAGWLHEHNQYKMTGPSRQTVHCGPWNEQNPENFLTELQIPIEEK